MKILLYGINFSPELTGVGKYTGETAGWLAAHGHDVRVVTAPPYYPDWKIWKGFSIWRFSKCIEDGVTVFRCPLYVPAKASALKRTLHLISFSLSSSPVLLAQLRWKPDVVILVVPTLFCAPQTLLLATIAGATSLIHIQDYEVDALFGLGIAKRRALKRFALAAERLILRNFDRVSTISPGMLQHARHKGVDNGKLLYFPNWSEPSRFRNASPCAALLDRLGVRRGQRVVLYSGSIGEKQGLDSVIKAAERLRNRADIVFLIVGEGGGKTRLRRLAEREGLRNILFAPLQHNNDLPALLASANCHLVVQRRGAADAVLPSKLTNILAVGGNAVITADPDTSLGLLCSERPGIATLVEPESVDALIDGIEHALAMPQPNSIAADYAKEFLDKQQILQRLLQQVYLNSTGSPSTVRSGI